jgi:glycogen debranching enzyme
LGAQGLTAVAVYKFVVSDDLGNIDAAEQQGVFAADTRFLSHFELTLGGLDLTLLRSGPAGFSESQVYLTNLGNDDVLAHDLELVRRRQLRRTGLTESITITNYGPKSVAFPLQLRFDADFADIFEVRSVAHVHRTTHTRVQNDGGDITFFDTLREDQRQTHIHFSTPPDSSEGGTVVFKRTLESRRQWAVEVEIEWKIPATDSSSPVPLSEDIGHQSVLQWIQQTPRLQTENVDLKRGYERSIHDLGALEIALNSGYPIPAAGLPWYLAIFGRDSIITSLQTLLLNQRHARGTLRTLAAYQATTDDPFRDAEPGKIAHEIRFGELALSQAVPHSRYYGSVDATPLWLILFGEYLRWTDDSALLNDLLPTAERALAWIDHSGDLDGDGFVEYSRRSKSGLVNQGWKDSYDSVRFADGRFAEGPIALVEVQGYVYSARLAMADVYDRLGRSDEASEQRNLAASLKAAVQDAFWMSDEGFFAMALDGKKQQVDGITSNPGHLLWCGLPDPEKASQVVERLIAPDLFSGWGIRTMSTKMKPFNPMSYHNGSVWPHDNGLIIAGMHRYGHNDATRRVTDAFIDALNWFPPHRLPELFCGYDRAQTPFPVDYPVACSPQAWAAGCVVQIAQVLLGLQITPDGPRSNPISENVTGMTGVLVHGERFDLDGLLTIPASPADQAATRGD